MHRNAGSAKLVLVIDSDEEARRRTRTLLEARGYDVVMATTGHAALELVQRLPASFELVLVETDLRGLPGLVVAETLRLFRPDIPVICLSGNRVLPAAHCLRKPLSEADLDEQLKTLGNGGGPRADAPNLANDAVRARARARYEAGGSLVEAAMELANVMPPSE